MDISDTTGGSNYFIGRFTGAGGSVQIVGNDGSARTALISQALNGNTGSLGTLTLQSTDGNSNPKVVVGANGGFDLQFDVPSSTVATTAMYIKNTSGNVGIGTTTPVAKLDVAGNIKVANSSATCGASNAGEIRYNTATSKHEGCNGTAWNDLY